MRGALIFLPSINASLKAAGLPPIVPSTEEIRTFPTRAPSAAYSHENEGEK